MNQWWLISWRIYASLGLNELNKTSVGSSYLYRTQSHWKKRVVIMRTLSSLGTLISQNVPMTTCVVASDDKVGIITTLCFQCLVITLLADSADSTTSNISFMSGKFLPSAHSGCRVLSCSAPSVRPSACPALVTTLQPTIFNGSCS